MTIDNEFELVIQWIAGRQANGQGDPELEALLFDAYQNDEHKISNDCNLFNELRWPWPRHPASVIHDRLYRLKAGRSYADRMMRRLNGYFGRPSRGWIRWFGVRIGGWLIYGQD